MASPPVRADRSGIPGRFGGSARALTKTLVAFALLLAATLWTWSNVAQETTRVARQRFDHNMSALQFAIEQRLVAYEQVLRGGVGLFAASEVVTREEWRAYVHGVAIERNYLGIQGIGFARRIAPVELQESIRQVREDGFPDFKVWPEGERGDYTAIVYLEPFDWRNRRAFGYDMFSERVRHEAMVRARDTGLPAASGRVTLVQETREEVQSGFLLYLPVYRNGASTATVEERRAALVGYVYAPFRMNDLLEGILGDDAPASVDLDIHDEREGAENLLYASDAERRKSRTAPAFSADASVDFNGRTWLLGFRSTPGFDAGIDVQKPAMILAGGLVISVLFAAFVWSSLLNRQRAGEVAEANLGLQAEIAERTRLAAELEKARDAAEAANEAKSRFLANVSHELRTPLTLILAPLDELGGLDRPPANWRDPLARIQRNALILLNRVNDLLDFSKAEAGKFSVHARRVALTAVLRPIAEDAAGVARRQGCTLDWQIDPALGTVCLDTDHLEKILLNLVGNALKFTPAGGSIRIAARVVDERWFELEVADTGIGIAAEALPRLFDRFQQVDASATRRHGGTGIGLALAKEITELMGGCIGVESRPGEGSRFCVRLPRNAQGGGEPAAPEAASGIEERTLSELRRARFAETARGPMPAAADAPSPVGGKGPRARVLVADDNADMRHYIAQLLGDDYDVIEAEDGQQVWDILQGDAVDVLVSDVMMPGIDGLTLTGRIKGSAEFARLPVILVTARGSAEARASGLEHGADDYLCKPFSPAELRARVGVAMRMRSIQEQLELKAREAGMAHVAGGILHNLGNALVGVNVSSASIEGRLRRSRVGKLQRLADLLQGGQGGASVVCHPAAGEEALPTYVATLADHLETEQAALLKEVEDLRVCTQHAAGVVASYRKLAGPVTAVRERVSADSLMETALTLARSAYDMKDVEIRREYAGRATVVVDRHKVLQILLNLLSNAHQAVLGPDGPAEARIEVRTESVPGGVRLTVRDNGVGIEPVHLDTLFHQRFSSKADGHGYGLHSSAVWAQELRGSLSAHSEGAGKGATFVLTLPALTVAPADAPAVAG